MNIDWDKAPEGAVELKQDTGCSNKEVTWFDGEGNRWWEEMWVQSEGEYWWQTIATRPTEKRKTVEDALEWAKGKWGSENYTHVKYNKIADNLFFAIGDYVGSYCYVVCTREEFEKAAAEKRGEQGWTHNYAGKLAKIITDNPDKNGYIIILTKIAGYLAVKPNSVKPIKPTITKAQAWDKFTNEGYTVARLQDEYEVTD